MNYSISADRAKQQHISKSLLNKAFSNYHQTFIFSLLQHTRIQLQHFTFRKQQSNGSFTNTRIAEEYLTQNNVEWQRLKQIAVTEEEWILMLERPFQIIFCLRKYKTLVPIVLDSELGFQQMACYVTYPQAMIYAYQTKNNCNVMYNLNLQTFQIKQINSVKEYSPSNRTHCWTHFSDSRLYVMGGVNKKSVSVDKLMWTYNMQNCYWFALESNVTINQSYNCEFENGKVLAIANEEIYIVQLYQSRVTKVQNWKQVLTVQNLRSARGVYVFQDWIYLLADKQLPRLRITKSKSNLE